MSPSYAVLIDGGFVKRKLGTSRQPAGIEAMRDLLGKVRSHACVADMRLHRVYFYDSRPLETAEDKPLKGGKVDFSVSPIVSRSQKLQRELAREPFVSLRMGELAFNGWRVDPRQLSKARGQSIEITEADLQPSIGQKGVDMRIGMDIAALTLKRQVQVIVLVTGDSDFVPAMKFARREGAQLFLAPLGHGVKESMREHCDLVIDLPVTRSSRLDRQALGEWVAAIPKSSVTLSPDDVGLGAPRFQDARSQTS